MPPTPLFIMGKCSPSNSLQLTDAALNVFCVGHSWFYFIFSGSHHQLSIINVNTSPERLMTLHCWLVIGNRGSNSRYYVLPRTPCCLRAVPSRPVDPLLADVLHSMLTFSCIICFTVHHLRKTLKVQLRRGAESLFAM